MSEQVPVTKADEQLARVIHLRLKRTLKAAGIADDLEIIALPEMLAEWREGLARIAHSPASLDGLVEDVQQAINDARDADNEPMEELLVRILAALSQPDAMREALEDTLASLVAAHSLLSRSSKKAAPSDKMFDQMMADYAESIERARAALNERQP